MRNNPPSDYYVKRRYSGDSVALNTLNANRGNLIPAVQAQELGLPVRANPEYYGEQNSAKYIAALQTAPEKPPEVLSFKTPEKPAEQQVIGFGTKKVPLSGATLNVPAFKPKYRKASHDFVNDPSTNMFASEVFVKPSEKAKDNTPRAPTSLMGGLEGLARKVVAKDDVEPESPLMKFKHTMLTPANTGEDLSKSAILGLGNNDWKENSNNGTEKGGKKVNNLESFRQKPVLQIGGEGISGVKVSGGSPLLPPGYEQKYTPTLPGSQSQTSSPLRMDLFKKRLVIQSDQMPAAPRRPEQPESLAQNSSPLRPALSFKRSETRSNQSIPSEGSSPTKTRQQGRTPKLIDFVLGKKLGKGRFGDVFLVKNKEIGFICAMKIISKQLVREQKFEEQLIRELKLQGFMNHVNIAGLYGCFDDKENVYLLIELCADGHLQRLLKEQKRLPEERARQLLTQICSGMDYMHREGVLHRDIKPQNVVLHEGIAKICDFGWAIHAGAGLRQTFCGTPLYVSPQLLLGEQYDHSVDAWAVGVLAYEMLVGRTPFKVTSADDLGKIITDELVFPSYVELSPDAKDFLKRALQKNPNDRMDLDEMLEHPFLKAAPAEVPQFELQL